MVSIFEDNSAQIPLDFGSLHNPQYLKLALETYLLRSHQNRSTFRPLSERRNAQVPETREQR